MEAPSPRRWQRRKDERTGEIIEAALGLFCEKGFSATKLDDIARAAGVTKGTPYLYFDGKEAILKAVVRATLIDRLGEIEAECRDYRGSRTVLIRRLMLKWWDEVGSTELAGLCKLMVAEAANFPELARFYHDEVIVRSRALMHAVLLDGVREGEFRPMPDTDAVIDALQAPLLMNMIWQHSFARFDESATGSYTKQRLETTLDLVLAALTAAGTTRQGNPTT